MNAGSGTGSRAVSSAVSSLTPGVTYHFRLVATSSLGTSRGADVGVHDGAVGDARPVDDAVVYGHFVTLSGVASSRQMGVKVTVLAQPFGENSFTPVGTALTGSGGHLEPSGQACDPHRVSGERRRRDEYARRRGRPAGRLPARDHEGPSLDDASSPARRSPRGSSSSSASRTAAG